MQINLIPDSSVSSAPAGFSAAIQAAAEIYDTDLPGNYTVNITYGWGTFDNTPDPELTNADSGAFSVGGWAGAEFVPISYAMAKSLMGADAAVASLPATARYPGSPYSVDGFPAGAHLIALTPAQKKALGLYSGSPDAVDGSIGFNIADASSTAADWEEGALCEIGHALGWGSGGDGSDQGSDFVATMMDLFRYGSPGEYQWTDGQPAYFSLDGGKTDLANFDPSFDPTLFTGLGPNEPFNIPFSLTSGAAPNLTSLDIEVFNLLGFGLPSVGSVVVNVSNFLAEQTMLDALAGGFAISDSAANVVANLGAINADAKVTSVAITSGAATLNVGTSVRVTKFSELGAGTILTVAEDVTHAGTFSEGVGSTLTISSGDALTFKGAWRLGGAVSGMGALVLAGVGVLAGGARLSVANWSVSGAGTTATLGEALTYAGTFLEGAGATLAQTGGGLTLKGNADFTGGRVTGSYMLSTEGATTVSGLTIGGAAEWRNTGAVTQSGGNVKIGDFSGDKATLYIAAKGTWAIADGSGIGRGSSTACDIDNAGLFEKTGAGTSTLAPSIINTGVMSVANGVLDLRGALSGTGSVDIGGGSTLELHGAVAHRQNFHFAADSTGEITLDDLDVSGSHLFRGGLSGFGAGDTIDAGAPFGVGTSFAYTPSSGGASGILTLVDGSKHASIDFVGDYTTASFIATPDGHGGTLLTFKA